MASSGTYQDIPVDRIRRGKYQPRKHFDQESLAELADTIRALGVIEPIVVRPVGEGYELLAGERRWRAAQLAGLHDIPAIVREVDNARAAEVSLVENIQREDLNPIEEAGAIQRLMDEHRYTQQMAAEHLGRSRTAIANQLRLLRLPEEVQQMVIAGQLDVGAAKVLPGRERNQQVTLARNAVRMGWTARDMEKRIRELDRPRDQARDDPMRLELERQSARLSEHTGLPSRIERDGKGGYTVTHRAASLDILEGYYELLGFTPDE